MSFDEAINSIKETDISSETTIYEMWIAKVESILINMGYERELVFSYSKADYKSSFKKATPASLLALAIHFRIENVVYIS